MIIKVVYLDGSWFLGRRTRKEAGTCPVLHETPGTHHFTVIAGDDRFTPLEGKEIAVPITNIRYFLLGDGERTI